MDDILDANHKSKANNSGWVILAEYSLDEWMLAAGRVDEPQVDCLLQKVLDLGVPLEYLKKMRRTLTQFVQKRTPSSDPAKDDQPDGIRVFCQARVVVAGIPAGDAPPADPDQAPGGSTQALPAETRQNAGWGYFLIKKGTISPGSSPAKPHNCVDLYLYQEGD